MNGVVSYFNKCKLVLTCVVKFKSNVTVDRKRDLFRSGGYNRRKVFRLLLGRNMTASKIFRRIFDTSVNNTHVP